MDDRARITPYADGPLIIRGPFALVDAEGREIEVGRRTIALCRCGRSQLRPFCDGTHTRTRFRAEGGLSEAARERHPTVAEAAGRPVGPAAGPRRGTVR